MLGFLDVNINETTVLLSFGALFAGIGAMLSGWAAITNARRKGREEASEGSSDE